MIKSHTYSRTSIIESLDPPVSWKTTSARQNTGVSIISNSDEFNDLKVKWNNLLDKSREPHPFLSWEWQYTWWEEFSQKQDELMIVIVSDGNDILAIAPFYIKKELFIRGLRLIGEGEADSSHVASHYHDIICREEDSRLAISHITKYLKAEQSWDYSSFSYVLDESYLFSILEGIAPRLSIKVPFGYQYRIDLGDDFEKKFQTYSKSTKKSFRLKRNRMKKFAELSLISLDLDNNIEESVSILEELHEFRQLSKGESSAFSDPAFKQFHLSLIQKLRGTNKAQLRALKHGDEIVACVLNYVSTTASTPIIYSYTTGFKSADDKRFSPMFVFDILDFEYSAIQGYSQYDLLTADGDISYKSTYKPCTQPVSRLCWFSANPKGVATFLYVRTRRFLSQLYSYLRSK